MKVIGGAGRLVGVKELLRAGGFNPGVQTELKRVLRDLVRDGRLERDGKRFGVPGEKHDRRSGPFKEPVARMVEVTPKTRGPKSKAGSAPRRTDSEPRRTESEPRRLTPRTHEAKAPRSPDRQAGKHRAPEPPRRASSGAQQVKGIIHHHPDGFAFLKPIVGQVSEDVFIPPDEARKVLDQDQVLVEVVPGRGGRTMGRVISVESRTRQLVVGTYFEGPRGAWVEAREAELGTIRVPPTQLARPGDAVRVRLGVGTALFRDRNSLTGEVAGSLGSPDDHSVEVLSVAYSRGFHDEFPPEVMDEADVIPLEVSEEEATAERRRDLRSMSLVTIDGEDARDFDDAIFVEPHAEGWRLVVAIADVAHYVQEGTALDDEALRRATSVYLPGRVLPMLPERLSNGICSLKPDVDRLCMVADMVITREGVTTQTALYPAVMRSRARCTYTEVHKVLNGELVPGRTELKPLFERANALAKTLTQMRLGRGAIDFDLPENRVVLGEDGLPTGMVARERHESHRLVEECMLAANEAVARFFRERGQPTVNRYHGEPDEERLGTFLGLLGAYGVNVTSEEGAVSSKELNRVLASLVGHPEQRALHQLALRSMMQAVYSSENTGHYGLGAEDYLHFTSPIRRYPDLLVHRLLKAGWARKKKLGGHALDAEASRLEELSVQCSERERAAMQTEREVNALYACLLMKDRIGETFAATVGGLSEHGFFVVLDSPPIEGFVRGESVGPEFELDTTTYRLNFADGQQVRVGQKATVELISVNFEKKQMEFGLISLEGVAAGPRRPRGGRVQESRRGGEGRRTERRPEGQRSEGRHGERRSDKGPDRKDNRRPAARFVDVQRAEPRTRSAPPPTPSASDSPSDGAPRPFSAREVLDRLWKERGPGGSSRTPRKK